LLFEKKKQTLKEHPTNPNLVSDHVREAHLLQGFWFSWKKRNGEGADDRCLCLSLGSNGLLAVAFRVPDAACVVGSRYGSGHCLPGGAQEGCSPESEGWGASQRCHHSAQRRIRVSVLLLYFFFGGGFASPFSLFTLEPCLSIFVVVPGP